MILNDKPIIIPPRLTDEPDEREAIVAEGCGLLNAEPVKKPQERPAPRR
jgi:hypothetical protein